MRSKPIAFSRFTSEVLEIYALERAKKTVAKMRQVLGEFTSLVKSTDDLKPATIARWRNAHPGRAPSTVHSLLRSLRAACAIGIASGYLTSSPLVVKQVWPELDQGDEDDEQHHAIAEIRAVLLHLAAQASTSWHAHRLYALVATVAYTGMRRNEALHLQVPDVDFDRRCIRIIARQKLKTRASAAPVGMPEELAAILEHWIPRTGAMWVFPGATRSCAWTGGPPGHKPLDRLKQAGLAAGVEGFTFQSLRHSWATHGEFWGLGETMIQRQLRHTTKRTQKRYRHPDIANIANSVASISFLGPAPAAAAATV